MVPKWKLVSAPRGLEESLRGIASRIGKAPIRELPSGQPLLSGSDHALENSGSNGGTDGWRDGMGKMLVTECRSPGDEWSVATRAALRLWLLASSKWKRSHVASALPEG